MYVYVYIYIYIYTPQTQRCCRRLDCRAASVLFNLILHHAHTSLVDFSTTPSNDLASINEGHNFSYWAPIDEGWGDQHATMTIMIVTLSCDCDLSLSLFLSLSFSVLSPVASLRRKCGRASVISWHLSFNNMATMFVSVLVLASVFLTTALIV